MGPRLLLGLARPVRPTTRTLLIRPTSLFLTRLKYSSKFYL